ncbi:hypothetical protein SEUCBS140593_007243 [Sporothrix eucalyptigena]|uniref:Aminoglycoside phosphotransferase domain-containing protein n=1 Tax=Sporothrix eucalyptigena TaxID=1812306 RepID=A0ABP0CBN5_9PEZI
MACTLPALSDDMSDIARLDLVSRQSGGQNAHLDIVFADGVVWLARMRLLDPLMPPAEVQTRVLESEVATLRFLAKTNVPTPRVYAFASTAQNPVGTPYLLMEKMPGKPLDWYTATVAQKDRVLEQLVDIYVELEKHPLPQTGCLSLADDEGTALVGPFVQLPCFVTRTSALGPYTTLIESYTAILHHHMHMLASGECGGADNQLRLDNYLAFLWRLHIMERLTEHDGPFYIKHYDDKGDHILVDELYTITGIIDWEWASAEAKPYAFSTPCMLWPVGDFFDGKNALSADEVRFAELMEKRGGRADLAVLAHNGRAWQRFLFFLGGGLPQSADEFDGLIRGLEGALEEMVGGHEQRTSFAEWKASLLAGNVADMDPQLAELVADSEVGQ